MELCALREPSVREFIETWRQHSWTATERNNTFGKHSKPPPVTLSNAKDRTLSGTNAANLQAIIAPVAAVTYKPKLESIVASRWF